MQSNYSEELKKFLENYSTYHNLNIEFSCSKIGNKYSIQSKNILTNETTQKYIQEDSVKQLIERSDKNAEKEICSIIFKTGPKGPEKTL